MKFEPVIHDICPQCGNEIESEGVDVGIGYVYPPFHCEHCGWSEGCCYEGKICLKCTEYEKCNNGRNG